MFIKIFCPGKGSSETKKSTFEHSLLGRIKDCDEIHLLQTFFVQQTDKFFCNKNNLSDKTFIMVGNTQCPSSIIYPSQEEARVATLSLKRRNKRTSQE